MSEKINELKPADIAVNTGNPELDKKVYIKELVDIFSLKQLTGDEKALDRWVIAPDINRPGLELSGYREDTELKRVILLGVKEQRYIQTLDYETQKARFDFLTDSYTPCIIITANAPIPESLKEVANAKNFPVFSFLDKTYVLTTELTAFLSERLSPTEQIHGTMMSIYGIGVLITGESGIGKSELALDLIKRGHILVADDVVEYSRVHNNIVCEAPSNIKRMLEVRGLGILEVNHMFGGACFLDKCNLSFVIKLVSADEYRKNNYNRLDPAVKTMNFFDVHKTMLEIPVTHGKNMSTIIESSVINHVLKKTGYDSTERFKQTIKEAIMKKQEEQK